MLKRLIVIIFILSSGLLFFFLGIFPFIKQEEVITIPQITNLSEAEGCSILDNAKINYEIIYVDGTSDVIQKTVPEANSLIKKSQTITVYVEKEKPQIIKDMRNMTCFDARILLEEYSKKYNITYEIQTRMIDDGINDIVLEQNVYDTDLSLIDKIIITISKCEYYVTMPDFIGRSYKEAFTFCQENGFIFEGIYLSSLLEKDTIIYQEQNIGTNLRKNSRNKLLFYIAK